MGNNRVVNTVAGYRTSSRNPINKRTSWSIAFYPWTYDPSINITFRQDPLSHITVSTDTCRFTRWPTYHSMSHLRYYICLPERAAVKYLFITLDYNTHDWMMRTTYTISLRQFSLSEEHLTLICILKKDIKMIAVNYVLVLNYGEYSQNNTKRSNYKRWSQNQFCSHHGYWYYILVSLAYFLLFFFFVFRLPVLKVRASSRNCPSTITRNASARREASMGRRVDKRVKRASTGLPGIIHHRHRPRRT